MQFGFDFQNGSFNPLGWQNEVLGRINVGAVECLRSFACQRVDDGEAFDFVAPELDAKCEFLICRPDLDDVATCSEVSSPEFWAY